MKFEGREAAFCLRLRLTLAAKCSEHTAWGRGENRFGPAVLHPAGTYPHPRLLLCQVGLTGPGHPASLQLSPRRWGKCRKDKNMPLNFYIKNKNHPAYVHTEQGACWSVALRATLLSPSGAGGSLHPGCPQFWATRLQDRRELGCPRGVKASCFGESCRPLPGTLPRVPTPTDSAELLGPHVGPSTGFPAHSAVPYVLSQTSPGECPGHLPTAGPRPPESPGGLPCAKPCLGCLWLPAVLSSQLGEKQAPARPGWTLGDTDTLLRHPQDAGPTGGRLASLVCLGLGDSSCQLPHPQRATLCSHPGDPCEL